LLLLVLSLCYATITPVILLFAAIFFGTAFVVFKYQLCFAYVKRYEKGGDMWPTVFRSVMVGLIICQLIVISTLVAKGSLSMALFVTPLVPITIFFNLYASRVFKRMISDIPLDITVSKNEVSQGTAPPPAPLNPTPPPKPTNIFQYVVNSLFTPSPQDLCKVDEAQQTQASIAMTSRIDQDNQEHSDLSSIDDTPRQRSACTLQTQNYNFRKAFPYVDPLEHPYPVRDDVSFYQVYEHPLFLKPLSTKIWLPLHPGFSGTWNLSETITLRLDALTEPPSSEPELDNDKEQDLRVRLSQEPLVLPNTPIKPTTLLLKSLTPTVNMYPSKSDTSVKSYEICQHSINRGMRLSLPSPIPGDRFSVHTSFGTCPNSTLSCDEEEDEDTTDDEAVF
jgi:hypothetical protein